MLTMMPLVGRIFFSLLFITAGFGHFSQTTIDYAAASGVPAPALFVPLAGILAIVGGFSVLLGYRGKIGAWLLIAFLLPVTLVMHRFWAEADPMVAMTQQIMFMKNLSMLGGALMITYFGTGPYSLDNRASFSVGAPASEPVEAAALRAEARALDTDLDVELPPDLSDANIDRTSFARKSQQKRSLVQNERDASPRDLH